MDLNKIDILNLYDLLENYISNLTSTSSNNTLQKDFLKHINKNQQIEIFSSIVNESFILIKIKENSTKTYYFKYLIPTSNTSSSFGIIKTTAEITNIISFGYNGFNSFFNIDNGVIYTYISENN